MRPHSNQSVPKWLAGLMLPAMLGWTTVGSAISVEIEGIEGELLDNVKAASRVQRLDTTQDSDPAFLNRLLVQAAEQAAQALEPFGYYNSEITHKLDMQSDIPIAQLRVEPGLQTRVGTISVRFMDNEGHPVEPEGVKFELPSGQPFLHAAYETAKRTVQIQLLESGHLDAQLEQHQVRVHRQSQRADIELEWLIGPRYRFGSITYSGSILKPRVLNRYADFKSGEFFRQSELAILRRGLLDSGYFENVDLNINKTADLLVNIEVELTHSARSIYEVGANFGTDTGPGVEASNQRRWLNSRGHGAALEAGVNQRRLSADLSYTVPRAADANSIFNFTTGYVDEDTDTSDRKTARIGAQRLGRWGRWRRTDGLTLLREQFDVGSDSDSSSLLIPSIGLSRTESDGSLTPASAWSMRAGLSGAVSALISDVSFIQMNFEYRWIRPVFKQDRLLLRTRLGATVTSNFSEIPASLRYFAGGDRSIRGFDFEALGPLNDEGEVEGGKYLILGSFEYEKKLTGPWRVSAFFDGGNALDDLDGPFEYGAGLGVRYETPVGLIRLDVASSLSDDRDIRLHFSFGPDL